MKAKVIELHYRDGSFSGEVYSPNNQQSIDFTGRVHYCNSLDGIEITDLEFNEPINPAEHPYLESIIYSELDNHCGEIYQDTQDDQLDAHGQAREDEMMGN